MEFLSGLAGYGGSALHMALSVLPLLAIVVFVHEFGHFLVARWCGVRVTDFSIGFGPEIAGFTDRKGTRWKLAWIPLGGYVKFLGDDNAASVPDRAALAGLSEEERRQSFVHKPLYQRALVVVAGPVANFILAVVVFATLFATVGRPITAPKVDQITPGSAAQAAGFEVGDLVLSIDGVPVETFSDMQRIVSTSAGQPLAFVVRRGDREVLLTATPERREIKDRFGNVHRLGLLGISRQAEPGEIQVKRYDPAAAVALAGKQVYFIVERTLNSVGGMILGRESVDQLSGPIRIAQVSGQVASIGLLAWVDFIALISVSIGLINLFPIPLLDGGHLLYYAVEAARGRPMSERAQELGFRVGLAIVLTLMIFATWNDLLQLKLL